MAIRSRQLPMCELLLEKHHADCKVSSWQLCNLASIGNLGILKLLIGNGALEKDSYSWAVRLSLMKSLDYSGSNRKTEKPSKEQVLTFFTKESLRTNKGGNG